jgi:hypothetical protein
VLAAFVLIDSGARGKGIYACLDAELPLREAHPEPRLPKALRDH